MTERRIPPIWTGGGFLAAILAADALLVLAVVWLLSPLR